MEFTKWNTVNGGQALRNTKKAARAAAKAGRTRGRVASRR